MSILKDLKTPVFNEEGVTKVDVLNYKVAFFRDDKPITTLTLTDIAALPQTTVNMRMTSVSGWSVRANWQGVLWRDMMAAIGGEPKFNFVMFESVDGYTTNAYREDIIEDRWLFCTHVDGQRLEHEYGWPLRIVIPNLWGYKSCKWLTKVTFSTENQPGFWETHGYTDRGLIEPSETLDVNTQTRRNITGGEVVEF